MPNPKPPYPVQFRELMVESVRANSKSGELAKEFGCYPTSTGVWVRLANKTNGVVPSQSGALSAAERQELRELRRNLRHAPHQCRTH